MPAHTSSEIISRWPEESREAAELVIKQYGEPHEASGTELVWYGVGSWKRIAAQKAFWSHEFPAPHTDSVESFVDYTVPNSMLSAVAAFDGSVMVERTTGEVSARCHDEQANCLALNLMDDIVTGRKGPEDARAYYASEFLDARRKKPTPYMNGLRFQPTMDAADPDTRVLSDEQLQEAEREGGGQG